MNAVLEPSPKTRHASWVDYRVETEALEFPLDFREWFPASQLLVWIEEGLIDLRTMRGGYPQDLQQPRNPLQTEPWLRVFSLAYATGIYGSEEISQAVASSPVFHALASSQAPFPGELRAFRRKHRDDLTWILSHLFQRVLAHRVSLPSEVVNRAGRQRAIEAAIERVDIARHMDNLE